MKKRKTADCRLQTRDRRRAPSGLIFVLSLLSLVSSLSVPSYAADYTAEYVPEMETEEPEKTEPIATPAPVARPPAVESEKAKSWKGLQAQEQWVARLKKQIDGETRQLSEMRTVLAGRYKLESQDLEEGVYMYDEEKDEFVTRLS